MQSSTPSADTVLRIGTRGSPLALVQAGQVRARLAAAHGLAPERIGIEIIRTSGDMIRDRPLSEVGGKGLFTKEIEDALLAGRIDLAVHSAKDMPTVLPAGLAIVAVLPREDPRDAFISRQSRTLHELPHGAVVGTASLRRQALVKRLRPDLAVVNFRGNVETRLRKLDAGEVDATLLALAGLKRLERADAATAILSTDEFLPAVGQGIIALEARADDARTRALLDAVNDRDGATALACERAFLAVLDGSCRTPIAGYATVRAGALAFRGLIARPDGSEVVEAARAGAVADAVALGADAGARAQGSAPAQISSRRCEACACSSPGRSPTASAPRRPCAHAATPSCWRRCCARDDRVRAPGPGVQRRRAHQRERGARHRGASRARAAHGADGVHRRPPHRRGRPRRWAFATSGPPTATSAISSISCAPILCARIFCDGVQRPRAAALSRRRGPRRRSRRRRPARAYRGGLSRAQGRCTFRRRSRRRWRSARSTASCIFPPAARRPISTAPRMTPSASPRWRRYIIVSPARSRRRCPPPAPPAVRIAARPDEVAMLELVGSG